MGQGIYSFTNFNFAIKLGEMPALHSDHFIYGKNLFTHRIEGWVEPIAGLDFLEKRQ
jgi:hypothetical protein